jgi:hypothetical protein
MRVASTGFRSALALTLMLFAPLGWGQPAPSACQQISSLSGTAPGAGSTNGVVGVFAPGDTVTITATLGTATAATFRIVGNSTGSPGLAGPAAVPATLTYTVTGPLPAGSIGIGYFIDTADGSVVIAASCVNVPIVIPTTSNGVLAAIALLLAASTALYLRRRR